MDGESTVITLLLILWTVSVSSIIVIYLRYAYANYRKSQRWEVLLIGSGFACGCVSGAIILKGDYSGGTLALGVLSSGCAFAIIFRFFFLHNIQRVIPKRPPPDDKS